MILSRRDIDGLADQIIRDSQRNAVGPFPSTDNDRLAEQYLSLRVFYDTLSANGSLLGGTAYDALDVQVQREFQAETYHLGRDTVLLDKRFLSRSGRPAEWDRLSRQRAFTECLRESPLRERWDESKQSAS